MSLHDKIMALEPVTTIDVMTPHDAILYRAAFRTARHEAARLALMEGIGDAEKAPPIAQPEALELAEQIMADLMCGACKGGLCENFAEKIGRLAALTQQSHSDIAREPKP